MIIKIKIKGLFRRKEDGKSLQCKIKVVTLHSESRKRKITALFRGAYGLQVSNNPPTRICNISMGDGT